MTLDAAGNRLNNAPEWSGSISAVYQFAIGGAGTASVRSDVSWQSRVFFTPVNDAIETQRAYGLLRLRAGFEPKNRRWEIAVYVRNLGNQEYITGTANVPPHRDHRPSRRPPPLGHAVHAAPLSRHEWTFAVTPQSPFCPSAKARNNSSQTSGSPQDIL